MLNLINKDLKSTVRNVFQELKEIMGWGGGGSGEKKYMKKISHEIKKITKKDRNYFTSRNSRNVEHNK